MRILITGSNGFLGSNLISHIENSHPDWEINGIDILKLQSQNYSYHQKEFNSSTNWMNYLNEVNPDYIIHTIGLFKINNNNLLFDVNTGGFLNFIESIRLSNLNPKVIIIGSAAEYGKINPEENPINETHPLDPTTLYGLTKKWQEEIAMYYFKMYGMKIICTRPSNFIGKGISTNLLPGYLSKQFMLNSKNIPINITNDSSIRDYIDIRDVCEILLKLLTINSCIGQAVNISQSLGISNLALIRMFEKVTGKKAIIEISNNDFDSVILANEKLKSYIGAISFCSLENSVKWSITL